MNIRLIIAVSSMMKLKKIEVIYLLQVKIALLKNLNPNYQVPGRF